MSTLRLYDTCHRRINESREGCCPQRPHRVETGGSHQRERHTFFVQTEMCLLTAARGDDEGPSSRR